MCAKPASPLGEKHIFENQSVKLGKGASVMPLLVTGAVLLVVLRLMKRLLPRVSAS